jgi:hypothetical protein
MNDLLENKNKHTNIIAITLNVVNSAVIDNIQPGTPNFFSHEHESITGAQYTVILVQRPSATSRFLCMRTNTMTTT